MKKELEQRTKQLVDAIVQENFKGKSGLLSGTSGTLFLLCYYSQYANDATYLDIVEQRISDTMDAINNDPDFSDLSYSTGITGFLWTLENLSIHQYIDIDLSDFKEAIHPILNDYMMNKMKDGDFDFLHGALGVANYFLDQRDSTSIKWIRQFNHELLSKATLHPDDTLSFTSNVYPDGKTVKVINFGLSHGMASIIYYLQRCLQHTELNTPQLRKELQQVISYYRKNQNNLSVEGSYFASWISPSGSKPSSRLAWCYGDLGIGLALLLAAETLNDNELKAYSIEILKSTTMRTDMKKEGVLDAGICHGSAGLMKIYRNVYRKTNIAEFKTTGDYWLQKTLQFAAHSSGPGGYKKFEQNKYQNDCGLLEGVTGIGIVLLEDLMDKALPWEKSLMLS